MGGGIKRGVNNFLHCMVLLLVIILMVWRLESMKELILTPCVSIKESTFKLYKCVCTARGFKNPPEREFLHSYRHRKLKSSLLRKISLSSYSTWKRSHTKRQKSGYMKNQYSYLTITYSFPRTNTH